MTGNAGEADFTVGDNAFLPLLEARPAKAQSIFCDLVYEFPYAAILVCETPTANGNQP